MPTQPSRWSESGVRHLQNGFIEHGFILVSIVFIDHLAEEARRRKLVCIADDHGLLASDKCANGRFRRHLRCFVEDAQIDVPEVDGGDDLVARRALDPRHGPHVGGRSAICCHLMNQVYYNGQKVKWDPEQLAFEIDSLMLGANAAFVLFEDDAALRRGLDAIRTRLEASAPR